MRYSVIFQHRYTLCNRAEHCFTCYFNKHHSIHHFCVVRMKFFCLLCNIQLNVNHSHLPVLQNISGYSSLTLSLQPDNYHSVLCQDPFNLHIEMRTHSIYLCVCFSFFYTVFYILTLKEELNCIKMRYLVLMVCIIYG